MADKLEQINDRLKKGKIGVSIELRGDRLSLRATLPPKPGETGSPRQQRIALGVLANSDGLEYAESEAKVIGGLLGKNQFDWTPYLTNDRRAETIGEWTEKLREQYFSEREETPTTVETWHHDYLFPLSRLPELETLTETCLKKHIFQLTKPNSRSRRRYALAYARIADLAGITHDLRELIGNYSTNTVSPRSLPTDEAIARLFDSIPDRSWRWIYGVMSSYGVRNHEAYFLDFEDYPIAYVDRGKTNERYIWPLYPEWADRWELENISRPECVRKTNSGYGERVTKGFQKLAIPFAPYNLRHSWARRSFEFGMDVTLAARMLGHSVKVHQETYRHWIDRDSFDRAYQRLITHPDRPLPPIN